MQDNQRLRLQVRGCTPCKDCTERFTACHDKCPKDARGERGYKAWKAEVEHVKQERKKFLAVQQDITKHIKQG